MSVNYICTYFYQEDDSANSTYSNMNLASKERTLVYWKTILVLFSTSLETNTGKGHVLFTNVSDFPFREELENLGVIIKDKIEIKHKNKGKWASVKYVFDVINFICDSDEFNPEDKFILLDTDCVITKSLDLTFYDIDDRVLAYAQQGDVDKDYIFHGKKVKELEEFYEIKTGNHIEIKQRVGGEFLGFKKESISDNLLEFKSLLENDVSSDITTEEQIWTMQHARLNYKVTGDHIYRVWSSIKYRDIPPNINDYAIWHLPSEKVDRYDIFMGYLTSNNKIVPQIKKELALDQKLMFWINKFKAKVLKL